MAQTRQAPRRAVQPPVGLEVEIDFTDLLANGQAVGRTGGIVVFCFGPLPGERALVRITGVKPKYAVAEMLNIVVGSPHRVAPFCPVFGDCGGCQVQHLAYQAQLDWKRDVVSNALTRIGGLKDAVVRETIGMDDPRHYRNKMSLVVDHAYAAPTIGFYKQRSHDVVPIEGCPIVETQLDEYVKQLNLARLDDDAAPALAKARHIVARSARATGQTVVTITTQEPSPEAARAAGVLMKRLPGVVGITNSFNPSSANAIIGRDHKVLAGEGEIEERIEGVRYRVSAGSFFQVNVEIVTKISRFIRAGLERPTSIVDLYCGAGTFSLFFAKLGARVFGIEENPQAVAEAVDNAELNGLGESTEFVCGRVEEAVRSKKAQEAFENAQIVFLDPPRKGSDEATLAAVAASNAPNVWYLSCDPATLARDLKFLTAKGYTIGVVQPFDMFPQTGHVETLVMLYREGVARAMPEEYSEFVIRED